MGAVGATIAQWFTPPQPENTPVSSTPPTQAPLPTTPTPDAALVEAQAQADQRRKTILATGGQTNVTGGSAILQPGQTSSKTLLGS